MQLLYLDYVDAPGCHVPWGEPRVEFWTDAEADVLKKADKGHGLYAVYGSCKLKNVEATCYAKAFEPLGQTTNMAGLGGFADLFSQLDDGNFSYEEREMIRKGVTSYAHENAAINNEYRVCVNNAEKKMNEETLKSTNRVMKIFATVCNNKAIRIGKLGGIPMFGATTSIARPITSTTVPSTPLDTSIESMPSTCADTHVTKSGAPNKVVRTKQQARK